MWPHCPQCGGQDLRIFPYDFGTSSETGYRDAGVRWQCHSCGAIGDAEELEAPRARRRPSAGDTVKTARDEALFLGATQPRGCEPLREDDSARNRMNQEKGQTTMNEVVKFPINTPVEVTLRFEAGKRVEGRYGDQVMYSLLDDRVMYVPPYVEQRFQELAIWAGEPLLLCKRAVKEGSRNRIEWSVKRAPQQPLSKLAHTRLFSGRGGGGSSADAAWEVGKRLSMVSVPKARG